MDDKVPYMKALDKYNNVIFRHLNTFDTTKGGQTLIKVVNNLPNVEIKCNSNVDGYEFNSKGEVQSVKVGETSIPCDIVVISNGP